MGLPEKFISLVVLLYANIRSRIHAYDNLLFEFTTRIRVRASCPPSPRLFNSVIEMIETALSLVENSGIDICSDKNLPDVEYAIGAVLLSKLRVFPDLLNGSVGVWFAFCTSEV